MQKLWYFIIYALLDTRESRNALPNTSYLNFLDFKKKIKYQGCLGIMHLQVLTIIEFEMENHLRPFQHLKRG